MTSAKDWMAGTRPRTLPAAVVPVAAGSGVAAGYGNFIAWRAVLALIVALALQVGVNFANDYSDGIRGTDEKRVGPLRLVASGLVPPARVRAASFICFGVAGAAGIGLAAATSWWLVPVGVACVAAGWFYTGGPKPYGYMGLGEVFVFCFFGLVATAGSAYVQSGRFNLWWAAVPVGFLATALLEANNLRDVSVDIPLGVVVAITGNGYKTVEAVAQSIEQPYVIEARLKEFDALFARLDGTRRALAGAA